MLNFLKNLFGKSSAAAENGSEEPFMGYHQSPADAPAIQAQAQAQAESAANGAQARSRGVQVSLAGILASLPLELQPCVLQTDVGNMTISIPLEKVLAQLSRGSVRLTYNELRHAAPSVFAPDPERDRVHVPLPLSEIVPRLNPALIQRRRVQKHVEVPEEVASPFDPMSRGLIAPLAQPAVEPPAAAELPSPRLAGTQESSTTHTGRLSYSVAKAAPQPTAPAAPLPPLDQATTLPPAPVKMPKAEPAARPLPKTNFIPKESIAPGAVPLKPAAPTPPTARAPQAAPVTPIAPIAFNSRPPTQGQPVTPLAPAAKSETPGPATAKAPEGSPAPITATPSGEVLEFPVTVLGAAWPEAIRKEIVDRHLVDCKVALPMTAVEQALRSGRLVFSWKSLSAWLRPAQPGYASPNESVVLELPLKDVTPVFLERQRRGVKPQQKVQVDEEIPNLFFGFPQTEAPAGAGAKLEDSNFYVWDDRNDTAMIDASAVKRGPGPGTRLMTKYATPSEVVARAAGMPGVVGALIALPDGLMVASKLPPDLNGDTLAAFLPQIFGKVSQCTKELRMGELNNLNFTVGNVPWKIFRVNAIFFAAFGRAGEGLPTAPLASLAAELNHKPK